MILHTQLLFLSVYFDSLSSEVGCPIVMGSTDHGLEKCHMILRWSVHLLDSTVLFHSLNPTKEERELVFVYSFSECCKRDQEMAQLNRM